MPRRPGARHACALPSPPALPMSTDQVPGPPLWPLGVESEMQRQVHHNSYKPVDSLPPSPDRTCKFLDAMVASIPAPWQGHGAYRMAKPTQCNMEQRERSRKMHSRATLVHLMLDALHQISLGPCSQARFLRAQCWFAALFRMLKHDVRAAHFVSRPAAATLVTSHARMQFGSLAAARDMHQVGVGK